jgi:hypothetical protein
VDVWGVILLLVGLWLVFGVCAFNTHIKTQRDQRRFRLSPAERALAEERSAALLRDVLDQHEYAQLMQRGYLDVASPSSPGRTYRIPRNAGRVVVYEHGCAQVELCVQPTIPLPNDDVIVMHKLMIEGNERVYLTRANEVLLADSC